MRKLTAFFVTVAFVLSCIMPPQGLAQVLSAIDVMSQPGMQVTLSQAFAPASLKGMLIHPNDPFKFDFIIDRGDGALTDEQKRQEYTKLVKYFLAALAVPDTEQWVNLSPYEKDRIIPDKFGMTVMGRDLLAQDYLLKQIASSLTSPDQDLGKKFWDGVYAEAYEKFGVTDIDTNVFNKVWIFPDKASVYEKGNGAYVVESHLKVMTDSDYLAMKNNGMAAVSEQDSAVREISNELMRQVIIPALEKEVNEGESFAPLRQVYSGMLLATWYKRALKESILARLYADQSKVNGVDQDPKNNEKIYTQYLEAFQKGVFNMIREDVDRYTNEIVPRKYFSGGTVGYINGVDKAQRFDEQDYAQKSRRYDLAAFQVKPSNDLKIPADKKKSVVSMLKKMPLWLAMAAGSIALWPMPTYPADVSLTWDKVSIALGYIAYIQAEKNGDWFEAANVEGVDNTTVTIGPLTQGKTYYFAVTAWNFNAEGEFQESRLSDTLSATMPVEPVVPVGYAFSTSSVTLNGKPMIKTSVRVFFESGVTPPAYKAVRVQTLKDGKWVTVVTANRRSSDGVTYFAYTPKDPLVKTTTLRAIADPAQADSAEMSVQKTPAVTSIVNTLKRTTLSLALLMSVALWNPLPAHAGSVSLGWTGVSNASGYIAYMHEQNGDWLEAADVVGVYNTTVTIGSLVQGKTYYFAVTAYSVDAEGNFQEGGMSNIVSETMPVEPVVPVGYAFSTSSVTLNGKRMIKTSVRAFFGTGVTPPDYKAVRVQTLKDGKWVTVVTANRRSSVDTYFAYTPKDPLANTTTLRAVVDQAQENPVEARNASDALVKGGIDFAESNLDMHIKRDGKGVPLPISQQNLEGIRLQGLVPQLLDVRSALGIPLFTERVL